MLVTVVVIDDVSVVVPELVKVVEVVAVVVLELDPDVVAVDVGLVVKLVVWLDVIELVWLVVGVVISQSAKVPSMTDAIAAVRVLAVDSQTAPSPLT